MWCSLKTKGGGLLGQHSLNAEKRRWVWTGFHYPAKLLCSAESQWAPFMETTMWTAPPRVPQGTTSISVLGRVCSWRIVFCLATSGGNSSPVWGQPKLQKGRTPIPITISKENICISPSPQLGCGQVSVKVSQPMLLPRTLHLNTVTWKSRLSRDHQRQH